jgi:DNA repair protein RadC
MFVGEGVVREAPSYSIPRYIWGANHAKAALAPILKDREIECFVIVHLGGDLENLQFTCHHGSATDVLSPTRKIIADAAELGTRGLLLAHNHPSGLLTPSDGDLRTTRRLASACEALDVTLVDHLIYGNGSWLSFREKGYL